MRRAAYSALSREGLPSHVLVEKHGQCPGLGWQISDVGCPGQGGLPGGGRSQWADEV